MVLLSFDIEEFDMPFEYGKAISFEDQIAISAEGSHKILDLLKKHKLKATFFSTATFAIAAVDVIERIKAEGHELASHTYYHSRFSPDDLLASRLKLEELSGMSVYGFRMPRMMSVDLKVMAEAGYLYNSSVNPTWLPGRYNNLNISRTGFLENDMVQLPASVTPLIRFPLFWLSFHNLPVWIYRAMIKWTYKTDGYINIYFHPWEFHNLDDKGRFGFPSYVIKNSGEAMYSRMDAFMGWINRENFQCGTIYDFVSANWEKNR